VRRVIWLCAGCMQIDLLGAALMGVLEGLTEFLPVSSTGHLILLSHLLGYNGEKVETFQIFIQLGALLAVVYLYFPKFLGLIGLAGESSSTEKGFQGWDGLSKLGVACLPAFAAGALLHSKIKEDWFKPHPVAWAMLVGGVLLILVEHRRRRPKVGTLGGLSLGDCLAAGCFQCLSLWPGMSRSGSTIFGGMLVGFERKLAAEFSFLLAVPTMSAAVAFDLWKSRSLLGMADVPVFALGFAVSFLVAMFAIKGFLGLLTSITLRPFGYYRAALGAAVLLFWR
jgi:undecaprenyl-diphosphatase